jgi:hypothetical protein
VGEIGLDFEQTDTIEEYSVSFNVQYWSAIEDGDPYTSATPVDPNANLNAVIS